MRLSSRHAITPFLFFGEFVKGLSFSVEPSTLALGRGDQRKRWPGLPSRLQHNDCFRWIKTRLFGVGAHLFVVGQITSCVQSRLHSVGGLQAIDYSRQQQELTDLSTYAWLSFLEPGGPADAAYTAQP